MVVISDRKIGGTGAQESSPCGVENGFSPEKEGVGGLVGPVAFKGSLMKQVMGQFRMAEHAVANLPRSKKCAV